LKVHKVFEVRMLRHMGNGEKKRVLRLSNVMLVPHCMDGRKAEEGNVVNGKQIGKDWEQK